MVCKMGTYISRKLFMLVVFLSLSFFVSVQTVFAQDRRNDCANGEAAEGLIQNDTAIQLNLVVCHNFFDTMGSGPSKDMVEVDAVWARRPSDNTIRPYKIGQTSGRMRLWKSIDTPRGYILISGESRCRPWDLCGWKGENHNGWPREGEPSYKLLRYNVSHYRDIWEKDNPQDYYNNCNDLDFQGTAWFSADNCKGTYRGYGTPVSTLTSDFTPSSFLVASGWSVKVMDGTGNYRCLNHSYFDLNVDYYPGTSKSLHGNVIGVDTYHDSTCGQSDQNQDGTIDNPGSNPAPQPGTSPSDPPPSNPQNPGGRLIIYTEKYYANPYYELETGAWDIENRQYRSISIPSGWSFVLEDVNGHQSCFNQSLHNLTDHEEWEFHIDGIYVFSYNVCQSNGGSSQPEPLGDWFIRLWTNRDYQGSSLKVQFTGDERYFWINSVRFPDINLNDDFESMELNNQRSVALYEHDSLQGGGKCFYDNDSDLGNDQFSNGLTIANQISSFRFFVGDTCTLTPLTPQDLWIHAADKTMVILTWPLSSPNADGFYVYRIDQNGNATRVAQLTEDQAKQNAAALGLSEYIRSWTFTTVTCGGDYTFAVSAYGDNGESARTRQATALTPPCDCNDRNYSGVGLYDQKYCQGDFTQMTSPGWYVLDGFNDRASSVYVKPGWSVEVFENSNNVDGLTNCFGESKWDLNYDNYWIEPKAVEGTLSNVRVWDAPNCGRTLPLVGCDAINTDKVTLFDYTHCLGMDKSLSGAGFYTLGSFDDTTSSIFVPAGKSARIYENENKEGNFLCVRETKWDLKYDPYWWDSSKNTFNNVSAVEVFDDALCGGVKKPDLLYPTSAYTITDQDHLIFEWQNVQVGGYWGELWGPNGYFKPSGHLQRNEWEVGTLEPGNYTWRVRAEMYAQLGEWSETSFVVIDTTPTPNLTVNYSLDPDLVNRVTFSVTNCSGAWVHVLFGHGNLETDSPCVNGKSTTQHDYPYFGEHVQYNAVVGGIAITVDLPRLKDCGELKPTIGVSLFSDRDCRGDRRDFAQIGSYELSTYNDQATAILVAPNWSVEVFENSNSSDGNAYCVTRDIWDLSFESYYATQGYKLDNTISNIRVYNNSTCGKEFPQYGGCDANIAFNGIVLFDYKHCGGSEMKLTKAGKIELGYGGSFNDLASSAHIAPGWSVQVFADSGWKGDQVCLHTNDKWDFGVDKYWNTQRLVGNSISSVEVFKNNACTPDAPPPPVKPNAPTNLLPSGGEFELGQTITLQWASVTGASYKIEISGTEQLTFTPTANQQAFTPQKTGSYTWRVKALKDGLESDWSTTAVFELIEKTRW
jgi:hypothetical protein